MSRKPKPARDPNSVVPFITSAAVILAAGIGISYLLSTTTRPGEPSNGSALVLVTSIVISGILFISAWAKRR